MSLQNLIEAEMAKCAFKARAKWHENLGKGTKELFAIEKAIYNKKSMSSLKLPNGLITTDARQIVTEQEKFYTNLYTSDPKVDFKLTNGTNWMVKETDKTALDAEITLDELTETVKTLKKQKTPGISGFSTEFYQFFWARIGNMYHQALNMAKEQGQLYLSACKGIITLIPKKTKDPLLLKNWCPLTMLDTDYKIVAKTLASRIKTVLPYLNDDCQTGFMEGRQITTTIRTTIDIAKYGKHKINGYLLSLDFEKCFDRIEYKAIIGSLRYFGFGEEYISWVNLLLQGFQSCTINNGQMSEFFMVTRSCHQGCNLAPYLYLLCGQVLATELQKRDAIKGITFNELEILLAQFADDTQLFLDTKQSLIEALRTLSQLEANIGLKVNYEKSNIYCIGNAKPIACDKPLTWDPGGLCILGVQVQEDSELTYHSILEKGSQVLSQWSRNWLPLVAKVTIINTLISSLYVYHMQVLPDPSELLYSRFEKSLHQFLWGNKRAKIPLRLLQQSKEKGGLRLVDLRSKNKSTKIAWLFCMDEFNSNQIKSIAPPELGILFWSCSLSTQDLLQLQLTVNEFWLHVCLHWFELKWVYEEVNPKNHQYQIIWYNSHIKIDSKVISNPELATKGCVYVYQLLKTDFTFKSATELKCEFGVDLGWLQHRALCAAIPRSWIRKMKELRTLEPPPSEDLYNKIV